VDTNAWSARVKVALVANRFPSTSETFIYNHAAGLRAAGVDVTVIATRRGNDAELFADFDGLRYDGPVVNQVVLPGDPLATTRNLATRLSRHGAGALAVLRAAQQRYGAGKRAVRAALISLPFDDFDIVHIEYSGIAVAWLDGLPLRAHAKLVVSCRGTAEKISPLVHADRAESLRAVFAACDRVHCVSLDMQRTCEQYGLDPAKAFVNRPAIDARRFRRSAPYVVRGRGPFRIVSTGRLHWTKGLEFGLLAIRQLLDAGRPVVYEIIGSGPDEERLRFALRDLGLTPHVSFRGRQSSTEVRAALEGADIYLLPSVSEGISNAALEAMAMEVPMVTTSAGGMNEAARDGIEAMVVPPRDPRAMAEGVAHLLDDGVRRATIGRAARVHVEREFSLERQVNVYLKEYDSLLRHA
jgi:colanic acid/amylovoran biosynthesis glycosyltransferase